MPHPVSDSEFHMWRALFALAFMDNRVSPQEMELLRAYQSDALFSQGQLEILRGDFMHPRKVEEMHAHITDPADKARFCALSRALLWCEGDADRQEEEILRRVSCLTAPAEREILRESRHHAQLHDYYASYEKAGMIGLLNDIGAGYDLRA